MKRTNLLLLILLALPVILGCFLTQGGYNYVPARGDCFVPPQGDAVYDQFYAQQVNGPNCDAYRVQEITQAQSEYIYSEALINRVEADRAFSDMAINTSGAVLTMIILVVA
jgi:hypothetical protein